jgi:stress-induced morphogen
MYRAMIEPSALRQRLLEAFPDAVVDLVDLTGTHDHYQASIVSRAFRGVSLLEQHRLVYRALGDLLLDDVHALRLTTRAPQVDA